MRAALATEWCAWADTYMRAPDRSSPSTRVRAATTAARLAIDPPVVSTPADPGPRPNRSHAHRTTPASMPHSTGAAAEMPV